MGKNGCAVHEESGIKVCKRDYSVDAKNVEAISFEPRGGGPVPALLLIPGRGGTARDWISNGLTYARNGYAGLAVAQPGYGRSEGPGDYVGPKTIKVLTEGYRRLQRDPFVDAKRMGIVGYSRGGMAASLLAIQQITRKWTLSSDRTTLTIDYYFDDQRESFEAKRVFLKK